MTETDTLFHLTGKVAMVTGATGRLGREMAVALSDMGASVVIVARTPEILGRLKEDLEARTRRQVLSVMADVQHEKQIHEVFHRTMEVFGRLDVLINNVTGNARESVETMPEAVWDNAMHKTLTSMFLCSQAAGRIMLPQGSGSIINISSIYGVAAADQRLYGDSGLNSSVVYGTAKAGVIQLTRYLAAYWGDKGIRVNAVTPGGVEDASNDHWEFRENYCNRTPMQRMMRREEIRGAVVFLASEASSYMTGHNLVVDGGFTVV